MDTAGLRRRDGSALASESIEAFRNGFHGQVILPGDAGYDAARRIWNAQIDKRPGLIARCAGVADIVAAVNFARTEGLLLSVRSGGHNVAGRGLCDNGMVIDLSGMRGVFVDPERRTARVQAGATLGDLDRETHLHGLAVPAGVVSRTGIAGLTLGGGVGWLVRRYGLTCDNLLACEVVTAAGEVVTASAEQNPDLFWGLRGGGGNFGIAASFLFQAHLVRTVLGGLLIYPRDQAAALLRHYREVMAGAPDELTAYAGFLTTPDGVPAVGLIVCHCGDPVEGQRAVDALRAFGPPMVDAVQLMPFPAMQRLLDDAFPDGTHNYWKSTFLQALTDEAIDVVVEHANRMTSPMSALVVELYSGAASRVAPDDTAFAFRHAQFNVGLMAQWQDAAESARHIAWTRQAWDALQPFSSGGYMGNFASEEAPEAVQHAFGSNHARLARLKAKYDPDNLFSLNQNILPAAESVAPL
ncbi:FAD-binding oxidoreductase [Geminicoccus flavidas]|uniref:FAD-binding oxidoreductase n=1 Tax=Geminicoccus flavidas TaxID=2506407 RepID=UPI001357148D|nr:FAD-binding oxidoreductase [Geminicoccus flavidas]